MGASRCGAGYTGEAAVGCSACPAGTYKVLLHPRFFDEQFGSAFRAIDYGRVGMDF